MTARTGDADVGACPMQRHGAGAVWLDLACEWAGDGSLDHAQANCRLRTAKPSRQVLCMVHGKQLKHHVKKARGIHYIMSGVVAHEVATLPEFVAPVPIALPRFAPSGILSAIWTCDPRPGPQLEICSPRSITRCAHCAMEVVA